MENTIKEIREIKEACNTLYCKLNDEVKQFYACHEDVMTKAFEEIDDIIRNIEYRKVIETLSRCAVYKNGSDGYKLISEHDDIRLSTGLEENGYHYAYNEKEDAYIVY